MMNDSKGPTYRWEKVPPIEIDDAGEITFNLDSDAGNGDWICSARLPKKEQEKRFNTPTYRWVLDDQ